MNRKDYENIAAIIAGDLATSWTVSEQRKMRAVTLSMADYFARTNTRFNRQRFYLACGLREDGRLLPTPSMNGANE